MNIGVFLFSNLGGSYSAANRAWLKGMDVLEIQPLAGFSQLIVRSKENLKSFADGFTNEEKCSIVNSALIESCSQAVLDCYFSMTQSSVKNNLVILESAFLGDIFRCADLALKKNGFLLDLKMSKGSLSHSMLLASFDSAQSLDAFTAETQKLSASSIKVTALNELSPEMANYL